MKTSTFKPQAGSSMTEVLVALVVVAVGLLGISKMQALAISSTRTSSVRSLIAIEAASLGSSTHANQGYWQSYLVTNNLLPFTATVSFNAAGTVATITSNDPSISTSINVPSTNCQSANCTAQALAALDLATWAASLYALTPTVASASVTGPQISCAVVSSVAVVSCDIQVQWTENAIGLVSGTGSSAAVQTFDLMVQP